MPFVELDDASPRSSLPGRFALALAYANVDAQTKLHADSFAALTKDDNVAEDWVQKILDQSSQEWTSLLHHRFPALLADGSAALNGFRHYMIQDTTYIEYYYRLQTEAIAKSGTFDELKGFSAKLAGDLAYVVSARDDCTTRLGVPKGVVDAEVKLEGWSTALKNSIELYKSVIKEGDWLDIHIVLSPCIIGYDIISKSLRGNQYTIRNTLYDLLWIEANAAYNTGTKYKTFINKSIDGLSKEERERRWNGWVDNFKKACETEKGFFNLGVANFPVYDVVSTDGAITVKNGTYTIRSYRKDKGYLAPGSGTSVTIKDLGADSKWELKNNVEGFSIKNVSKKTYLYAALKTGTPELSYKVTLSSAEKFWAVNSIPAYKDLTTQKSFQVLVSDSLQFVLDARSQTDHPKVSVKNNSQISDQIWVIEEAK